jgi:hypothetical protein
MTEDNDEQAVEKVEEFSLRLLGVAIGAERLMPPPDVVQAMLGVVVNYALRRFTERGLAAMLRETAAKIERLPPPSVGPIN